MRARPLEFAILKVRIEKDEKVDAAVISRSAFSIF
jgi:hypothetical protein